MAGYVAVAIPARTVRVSNTTLFRVAADYLGDALYWTRIALLNNMVDPWIGHLTELQIPRTDASVAIPDGILGSFPISVPATPVAEVPAIAAAVTKPALTMADITALIPYLPTELPGSPGILWSNGGVVSIS